MSKHNCKGAAALTCLLSAGLLAAPTAIAADESNLSQCIREVMVLDEGRWQYVGTIATLSGKFRTYQTTSVHRSVENGIWSSLAFGGDVGGTEEEAEATRVKIVGNSVVPLVQGEPNEAAAIRYLSCSGPDPEGRYAVTREYRIPNGDGTYDLAKNSGWYSPFGSYFAEDHFNEEGRLVARRSGVYMPSKN